MRLNILTLSIISLLILGACDSKDGLNDIDITERGTVTDNDGNEYGWVRIGNLRWTTSNAQNGAPAEETTYWSGWSWSNAFTDAEQEDFRENIKPVYGNYMDYEEALASAPEGWRLPTDEDWQALERALGLRNPDTYGYRGDGLGFKMQECGTGCELGLLNGGGMTWKAVYGWKELELDEKGEYGYYWTATRAENVDDTERAYYRKICAVYGKVDRDRTGTDCKFSVRWVSDCR